MLAAVLVVATATPAFAQLVPGWNTKQFTLERLDADRVRLMRDVEIEGEAGSPNAGQKFFADDLQLNTRTGELIAEGNVVFSTPTARISADSATFNTHSKLGTFTNATGLAQLGERGARDRSMFGTLEPDVYFYGRTVEKIGPDKYKLTKGGFTTCVQPTPRWEIVSTTATINLGDYAFLRNAVIHVKEVPVFYLPAIYYPIQDDERATGFLMPTYGSSTFRGQSISNAFFWAISRSQDATLMHDWFMSRGQGMGAEYRYLLSPASQGQFRTYWLKERATTTNGVAADPRKSYEIRGSLTQGLPARLRARARVEYFSSLTVRQQYNQNFYDASSSTRTIGGGVSGSLKGLNVSGNFLRSEYFYDASNSFVSGAAPGVNLSYSGQRIANLPLYASATADATRVLYITRVGATENDFGLTKVDLLPSLRAPLSKLPFLTVNASVGYRVTRFSESLGARGNQIEVPLTRTYADLRADVVGPVFTKVFTPNNRFADRMKHIVEPTFTAQRITNIDNQDRVPRTAGAYDYIVGGTTRLGYGVTNRFFVRKAADRAPVGTGSTDLASSPPSLPGVTAPPPSAPARPSSAPRELMNVGISQSYYTNKNASVYDPSYSYSYGFRPPSAFSPVLLVARAAPTALVGVDVRTEYDPIAVTKKLTGLGINGVVRARMIESTAGWSRQTYGGGSFVSSNNYIQQNTALRFANNKYGGTVQFNYDIGRSTLLQHRYIGYYNAQCCGISIEYQAYNFPSNPLFPIPQDRRFNFAVTLAGVGSFSNFFGSFGGRSY
jgi:LPS-assembly protein